MSQHLLIKCSTNKACSNKIPPWEWETKSTTWELFEGSVEELLNEYIFKGYAINQSLFETGKSHKAVNAFGGNLIVLDLDDGITFDEILKSYTYQKYGCFIYASASCGVVASKDGVDGRERWRVGFRLEREVETDHWTTDISELDGNKKRLHLERQACTRFLSDNFCADVGIAKLKDNCHTAAGQPFFGNDGVTPIPETYDYQSRLVLTEYPCSQEKRFHINDGVLPAIDIDRIIEAHIASNPEVMQPIERKAAEELTREAAIARWIFNNDLLSEEQLTDRDIAVKQVIATARGLGDDTLLDDFLETMERVMDGHHWRELPALEHAWFSFSENSSFTVGTLIMLADEASPEWRSSCPYLNGGGDKKYPVPPLAHAFTLLKSTNPINIII